jgi:hypothetical protein
MGLVTKMDWLTVGRNETLANHFARRQLFGIRLIDLLFDPEEAVSSSEISVNFYPTTWHCRGTR